MFPIRITTLKEQMSVDPKSYNTRRKVEGYYVPSATLVIKYDF